MLTSLLILTITFFIFTLYSILQNNAALFHLEHSHFLSLKILDTSSAASLFVTLFGALVLRHQFALSVLPRINYRSSLTVKNNNSPTNESCETWRVEIRNTGLGSATITGADYIVELTTSRTNVCVHTTENLIKELLKIGLIRNKDYWMDNTTSGFSLSPKDECFLSEIKTEHLNKLNHLSMILYFQGQLGDKYSKEISFLPHIT